LKRITIESTFYPPSNLAPSRMTENGTPQTSEKEEELLQPSPSSGRVEQPKAVPANLPVLPEDETVSGPVVLAMKTSSDQGVGNDPTERRSYSREDSREESISSVATATTTTSNMKIPEIPAAASSGTEDDEDEDDDLSHDEDRIRLGICAMDKKARSKPMAEILSRLDEDLFKVVFFGDQVILNDPIEDWPVCDVLIAFFSKGYPLPKAKEYVALRKPHILNGLEMQELMQDRRRVYDLLESSGIDVPRHAYLSRDGYVSTGTGDGNGAKDLEVAEFDDHIEINGISIHKPFVEKPVNAEGMSNWDVLSLIIFVL
jgi:hypothetical protein